jgi:putative peptidoglycan lipid II flippase
MLLFSALSSIMMGVEYSFDEYLLPAIAPIVRALIMVSALVLFHRELGIFAAAWGCAAGAAAEFAVLYAKSGGRGARPALAFLNRHLRDFLKLLAPLFFGNLIFKSATFVDKYIASFLAVGAVTYLTFAGKVARLLSRFVSKGIGITIFPELSATHATRQWERFREIVKVGLNGVLFVVIPVLAVMVLFNEEIIYVLFRSPRFDLEDVRGAAAAFLLLSGMVLAFSINQIINKIYYSAKDTKLPVLINIIVFFPGIALKVLFARHIGFLGVALGSSLMALATVTVMIWVVARKRQLHIFRSIGAEAGKLCGAGVLAALLAYGLKHYLHANVVVFQDRPHIILYSLLLGLLMVLVYFTLAVGFRNTIALRFKNLIFEKLERTSHGRDNKE